MDADTFATLTEAAIPVIGGIYCALLGHRVVGKKPGESERYDRWHRQNGAMFRVIGPLLVLFGIFPAFRGFVMAG